MLGVARAALLSTAACVKQFYDDSVTALEPVAYWRLNEAGGATIVDARGVQHGTYSGAIEYGLDPLVHHSTDTSVAFDGATAFGRIPHNAAFAAPNGTIAFAVQADSVSGQQMLVAKDGGLPLGGLTVDINNGRLRAYLRNAAGGGTAQWLPDPGGAANISTDIAHHVALTWGSRGAELWLDGTLAASNAGLTVGLGSNSADLFLAAYPGPTAFADVVIDEVVFFDRQLDPQSIGALGRARTITHAQGGQSGAGIQIPEFEYQVTSDAVPDGAIWWNPTSGNDGNNGTAKTSAKKTFAAAEALVSAGGTIVVTGGTHALAAAIAPTKSGSTANFITLRAEPNAAVVFVRDSDFLGAMQRTWTWTLVDAAKKIWESPNLGISDGATTVTPGGGGNEATGSNWLAGFIRIPNGARGRPHLMRLPWVTPGHIANPTTGNGSMSNVYGHPVVASMGNGRIRIRMQKPPSAFTGSEWPTDGVMGGLIAANGTWAEPATENPNDYEIHIVRWGGDFGGANKDLFSWNGRSWWRVYGINAALINRMGTIENCSNLLFEKCTMYPQWCVNRYNQNTTNITHRRCRYLCADARHMDWTQHKNGGYYFQHMRSTPVLGGGASTSHQNVLFEHCIFFGWFDVLLPTREGGKITYDHCAMLNCGQDDGVQVQTTHAFNLEIKYCYWAGGIFGLEGGSATDGGVRWNCHHNIIENRIPQLWAAANGSSSIKGVGMSGPWTGHSGTSTSPCKPMNFCYNTVVISPDARNDHPWSIEPGTSIEAHNITSGLVHSVFNNIFTLRSSRRYPDGGGADQIVGHLSCQQSLAGWQRFDYNCYDRTGVPNPVQPAFFEIQNGYRSGRSSYSSLAAFRASAHKTTSLSMYTDGTDGHEEHGVQVNPGFVEIAALDFRPTHASVISGAKNVTSLIGGSFENWKGALNPAGNGSEVGPQNP